LATSRKQGSTDFTHTTTYIPLDSPQLNRTHQHQLELILGMPRKRKQNLKCSLPSALCPNPAASLVLNGQRDGAGHGAVLERVQHLQVASGLTPLEVGDVLPEPIHTSEGHEPLRIELPGVPGSTTMISTAAKQIVQGKQTDKQVMELTSPQYVEDRPGRSCSSGWGRPGTSQRSPQAELRPCRPGTGQCGSQTRRAR
jgi:hypothetical protein